MNVAVLALAPALLGKLRPDPVHSEPVRDSNREPYRIVPAPFVAESVAGAPVRGLDLVLRNRAKQGITLPAGRRH